MIDEELRLAQDRICEAAIMLASGRAADAIADALLIALSHLERIEEAIVGGAARPGQGHAPAP
ncbi:MAG: hypothetical protein SFX73_13415 [Kofleriaceae bacterium]|nr:hypothetical protein [Kofleriaceae bacterium]